MKEVIRKELANYPDVISFLVRITLPLILTFGIKGVRGGENPMPLKSLIFTSSTTSACTRPRLENQLEP